MTVPVYSTTWAQGEDLLFSFIYKSGPAGYEQPVDLTGSSLRMDIVTLNGQRRYTFNSNDITDVDPNLEGNQGDSIDEAVLKSDGTINIKVPRSLTLPGGNLFEDINDNQLAFNYDIFIRDSAGSQKKILQGFITIEKSYTLWT